MLAGLPESYESLNMSLASLPDDKFNSAEISRILLAECDRRRSRQDVETDAHKEALHVSKRNDRRPNKETGRDKSKTLVMFQL